MKLDPRSRVHILGVLVGAGVAVWAAAQGDWPFAAIFAVATVILGLGVAHRIRQEQRDGE